MKLRTDNKKNTLEQLANELRNHFYQEDFLKQATENDLKFLKNSLEEKKRQIEILKTQTPKIPAQFLASQKLALNKRKYSPKKLNPTTLPPAAKRSKSYTK